MRLLAVSLLFMLSSCAIFHTAHDQFIASMNAVVNGTNTLEQLSDSHYSGISPADAKLIHKESKDNNTAIYHYSRANLWKRRCHYHLIVNTKTNIVTGWGFDSDKSDPKKECGVSG